MSNVIKVSKIQPTIKSFVNTYKPASTSSHSCHYPMVYDDFDDCGYDSAWWRDYYRDLMDDDYDSFIDIFFYSDIDNTIHGGRNECDEHFTSIMDLKEYCRCNGITIKISELDVVRSSAISHCCIDPVARRDKGELTLVCDRSYGGLVWKCASDDSVRW